jgi:uncharacterized membrane-anchored protein
MANPIRRSSYVLLTVFIQLIALPLVPRDAAAQEAPASDPQQQQAELAWTQAREALVEGPASIELKNQASLALPADFGFVPKKEAAAVMKVMGNVTGPAFIGLVFPLAEDKNYFFAIDYEDSGYIKDDDAREWDADELLQSLKDGTESANIQRERQGIPSIVVTRWIEPPAYDNATHRLVWSAEIRLKHGDDPDPGVNYNTYVLGREGYVSLNLITSASSIGNDKSAAHDLLAAIQFNDGRRYTDFNSSTDKVAAYGLAALIGGIAAKKLGLLALLAATLAKFGKLIFVGAVLAGGALMKWLRSRSAKQNTSA